jgi:hypothetical protein
MCALFAEKDIIEVDAVGYTHSSSTTTANLSYRRDRNDVQV